MARGAKKGVGISATQVLLAAILVVAVILLANTANFTGLFTFGSANATATPGAVNLSASPTSAAIPTTDYPPELYARLKAYQSAPDAVSKRPAYFGSITDEIFKELPSFPKDFYVIKLLFELGKVTDPSKITIDYWKQPEFYPQFEEQGVSMMTNPPKGRWGAFGYGSYPSETVVLSPKQGTFKVHFFLHTSWLVQTYQGLSLSASFPASATLQKTSFPDNTKSIVQDASVVRDYFDVDVSPSVILLEPAFPVFKPEWTQMVTVTVKVKNPPSGKYAIGINAGAAPAEKANEWLWKYKTNYVGGAGHSIGMPWYTIYIDV